MDEKEKKLAAAEAHLEQESCAVRDIGRMVKVSEMELIILVNLSYLYCLLGFSQMTDNGKSAVAADAAEKFKAELTKYFADEKRPDGLYRLMQSCAAIIGNERLGQYLIRESQ